MSRAYKKPGRVKAALLNWLGVPISLQDEAFWQAWINNSSAAGQTVNDKTVMSLSAAWACSRLVSESIGSLPIRLYERTENGRRAAVEHPLYRILHRSPNAKSTPTTYWESKAAAMVLRGNGLSEKQVINGRLVGLKFLNPNRLSAFTDSAGKDHVMYTERSGKQREIPQNRLFHIPGFSLNGEWGLSVISYGASVFGSALAASQAANKTFEKGLQPAVYFKTDKIVKKEQRTEFRQNLNEIRGTMNAGESPLLEGGMSAETIGISPSDAQLLESRGFSVEEVCRWFLVDPSMVGHGNKDSNWGTGLEQKMLRYITFTLRPYLTRIEQSINKQLLSPADQERYYAEFAIEALLRGDSAARAAFYSVMVNNGINTRDEVRTHEKMPTKGRNADVLTVQIAMAQQDSLGQQSQQQGAENE
ncbi:MAG: phage portal protein [Shewanella algae]